MRHPIALLPLAAFAPAAAAQPVVNYSIERWAVTDFAHDLGNADYGPTYIATYPSGRDTPGRLLGSNNNHPGNWLQPGESLLLRVRMNMPTIGTTADTDGSLGPLSAFGVANFNVSFGNGLGGGTWAGSAPVSPSAYDGGFAGTAWEDLVENLESFYDGPGNVTSPDQVAPGADFIGPIVVAQIPGFTNPHSFGNNPHVVDIIWTPTDYSEREVTYTFSDGWEVTTLFARGINFGSWVEVSSTLAAHSGAIHIVPAPASLALLALGTAAAVRRRRA